jgi:phosphate starvation-inducible membrane PsiE
MPREDLKGTLDRVGDTLVRAFQIVALFVIGGTIVWSAGTDYLRMMATGHAKLDDILLLFIYLELGTIVGIYFRTDRLPVLFLLYVAITALTRFLAVDVKELSMESVLVVTGSIFVLTLAVLVVQVGASRFPMPLDRRGSAAKIDAGHASHD